MTEPYLPADTSLDAIRVQHAIFRRMSPEQRLRQASRMADQARARSTAGVYFSHPEYTPRQAQLTVIRLVLGEELFREAFPAEGGQPMTQEEVLVEVADRLEAAGIPFVVV